MNIPITQSKAWQKLQEDLGEKSFMDESPDYHYLAILKHTPTGNYLYCPYGPCYENKQGFSRAMDSLIEIAKKHNAVFIRIEPRDPKFHTYAPKNAKKSKDLNPKETWLLDLSSDDLDEKLPSRLLRYYKAAENKGITINTSHDPADIHYLLDLQKSLADKKGISTFSEGYLKTELQQPFATLYLARYNATKDERVTPPKGDPRESRAGEEVAAGPAQDTAGPADTKIIAAGLVFDDATTRYNLQGAQSDEGRHLHATGILTIQLIKDAKAKGLSKFDFWGIAPEGAPDSHPWAGFTNFKKTFKGYEQDYAGTYDIVLKPAKYKLYQSTRKLNRIIRKAK